MSKSLIHVLPREFAHEHYGSRAFGFALVHVTIKHDGTLDRWPGREKFVWNWYELANGYSVGWNENPSRGWSFPVIKFRSLPATKGEPR